MKKQTIALALLTALTTGSAFADNIGDAIDDALINGSGFEIGRNSQDDSVSKFFDKDGQTQEQRQQAAAEYVGKVIRNGGNPVGDADKFASKSTNEGTQSAHDHIMADGINAIKNSPEFKSMSNADFKNKFGFDKPTQAEMNQAEQHHNGQRGSRDEALRTNGNVIADADKSAQIDDNKEAIKGNSDRIKDNRNVIDENSKNIDKNADGVDANKRAVEEVSKRGESERSRIENESKSRDKATNERVDANKGEIKGNADQIAKNKSEQNTRDNQQDNKIHANKGEIDKNRTNIDANKDAIKGNADQIAKNKSEQNTRDNQQDNKIHANKGKIDSNTKRIDDEVAKGDEITKRATKSIEDEIQKQDEWNKETDSIGQEVIDSAQSTFDSQQSSINSNSEAIAQNSGRIDNLENALKQQGEEMKERYDGVKATMHAVTNARPVAYDVGEFAVGAGMGAAGSKQALAIGGAYRFNESWSASFTTAYETAGKQTKADFSAGVGAHYSFK